MAITKVAVVGWLGPSPADTCIQASGNYGKVITTELVKAGFDVTAVSRATSTSKSPEGVSSTLKIDYDSPDALRDAFSGQDAVVCVINGYAYEVQNKLVDAAVAAGVQRFIPSEFGTHSENSRFKSSPFAMFLSTRVAALEYIKSKAESSSGTTWTGIATGMATDFGLDFGTLGFDKSTKTATIFDSGNKGMEAITPRGMGRAIAAVLKNPEQTVNRYIQLSEFYFTQNEILGYVEELTGTKWNIKHAKTADEAIASGEAMKKGDMINAFISAIRVYLMDDSSEPAITPESFFNDSVGFPRANVKELLRTWLSS
ncbi:hypothetical protein yc1106_05267 [Curvularia clavata]|uniref:NmrA-like domain-containing protein n=1 Tax=Curvularia clavata TaxID=95742 RepID=A0A9Q9DRX0_CURCL|nr:hypothetical protein yc1106_05267 [Curvularia clavata]